MSEESKDVSLDDCVPDPAERLGQDLTGEEAVMPSLFMHIVRSLRPGQDLTRVMIPVFFLEPRSLLEKFTDLCMHLQLLLEAPTLDDPLDRMLQIVRWFLSGWHYKTKGIKKPYNPVIGETFACFWKHEDSESHYYTEQVTHHPPVSAMYFENRKKHIMANGQVWTKSKFLGNCSSVALEGGVSLHLLNRSEVYEITLPAIYANGLFLGTLRMELGDKCSIECPTTGYSAEFEFKQKPLWGGETGRVKAEIKDPSGDVVYLIEGKWDDVMVIKRGPSGTPGKVFLDIKSLPILPKYVLPEEKQGDWESRKLWGEATAAMRDPSGPDWDQVQLYKSSLEAAQRALPCHTNPGVNKWDTKKFHERERTWHGETCMRWVFDDLLDTPYEEGEPPREFISLSRNLPDRRPATGKEKLRDLDPAAIRGAAEKAPVIVEEEGSSSASPASPS